MYVVVFITASSEQEAQRIADALIAARLVACVNIIKEVKSVFWWEGKVDTAGEVLLIAKSKRAKLSGLIKAAKSVHSYQVPEIIALPIVGGEKKYLRWIDESVKPKRKPR
ncbi:MAG TPA: divalent-cation tolerance protein CutA [Patescibacteria group bacterium]|nr:divalent-cation tolerance protein CutA [Patescibacteria group bacterium]